MLRYFDIAKMPAVKHVQTDGTNIEMSSQTKSKQATNLTTERKSFSPKSH